MFVRISSRHIRSAKRRRSFARPQCMLLAVLAAAAILAVPLRADELELTSGRRYQGKLIAKTPEFVTFRVIMGGGSAELQFPAAKVRSITLGPLPAPPEPKPKPPSKPVPPKKPDPPAKVGPGAGRSRAQVEALIRSAGATKPDWWGSVELNYPKTLDLVGTRRTKGWQPTQKLGAYIYDIANPDPSKWRSTIKLFHHVIEVQKNDPRRLRTSMETLGRLYLTYEKDYARTAYWYRRAAKSGGTIYLQNPLMLARCYYKLGNKGMAQAVLQRIRNDPSNDSALVKLWGEIGETAKALAMAEAKARAGAPDSAYLVAGDICRYNGDFKQAAAYYQKVLNAKSGARRGRYLIKNQKTAADALAAVRAVDGLDLSAVPDGTYTGSATGFRNQIQVEVRVAGGRIESVRVVRQSETFSLGGVTEVPRQIVAKQGIQGVDAVTCATVTSQAILYAAGKALGSAAK